MGTRNLTMVVKNQKPVVAQYGQWDGYPSGQGAVIVKFLRNTNLNEFSKQIDKVKFINKKKQTEINNFVKDLGSKDGWLTGEQSAKYQEKYPLLTRDNGGSILELIMEQKGKGNIWIQDSSTFAADSLFCEYAYVVDLDSNTLEVYEGFNETPLSEGERFYPLQEKGLHIEEHRNDNQYYPVKLLTKFDLNEIPDEDTFVSKCEELLKADA